MDVFLVAIVLFAAMAFGAGDKQREGPADTSNISPESEARSVTHERSDHLCDPWVGHMLQRNLTVPLDQKIIDDEH